MGAGRGPPLASLSNGSTLDREKVGEMPGRRWGDATHPVRVNESREGRKVCRKHLLSPRDRDGVGKRWGEIRQVDRELERA